jgi:hypothetical protein
MLVLGVIIVPGPFIKLLRQSFFIIPNDDLWMSLGNDINSNNFAFILIKKF